MKVFMDFKARKMTNRKIDYTEKANRLFNWFEEKKFERERNDVSRDFELVCAYSDWLDTFETGDLAEMTGLYADFKDTDDAEKEEMKLMAYIRKGIDKYLGNPVEELIKKLQGAEKC